MKTTYTGPVKDRGVNAQGKANVSREELADFKRKYGANKTLRDLLNADRTGKAPSPAAPAGPRRNPEAEAKRSADTAAMMERMKSRAGRGERVSSNEEERDRAKERTMAALGAMPMVGAASKLAGAAKSAAPKMAPRVEPRVGRPVTSKLDDAAAAFSSPRAAELAKSTAKEMPRADRLILKPATERGGPIARAAKRKAEEAAAKTRVERSRALAEAKAAQPILRTDKPRQSPRSRTEETTDVEFRKGGSVKGSGCETRGKKARYI